MNVTPFVFDTFVVRKMIATIEQKESCSLIEVFEKYPKQLFLEFFLYQAFIRYSGGILSDFYEPTGLGKYNSCDLNVTIWDDVPARKPAFERCMTIVEAESRIKSFAIHWPAILHLSCAQRDRIFALWHSRGLIDSLAEASKILDWQIANLTDSDRRWAIIRDFPSPNFPEDAKLNNSPGQPALAVEPENVGNVG